MTSAVVVGGGLVGLSVAWHLRRADPTARVTVLERAAVGAAASGASAAGVRAMGRDPAERAMALDSLARWPDLDRELEGSTGYRRGGGLRVTESEIEQTAAGADAAAQRTDGVPVALVDAGDARRIAPGLAPAVVGGVHCPIDGQADALATVHAFASAARRLGADVREGAAFTPDGLPVLGPVPGIDGLLVAAGFSGHGFALAPVVGEVLARLALARDPLSHLWKDLHVARASTCPAPAAADPG